MLGRQVDTAVANGREGHVVLNTDRWSLESNGEFVRGTIDYQRPVYLASPIEENMIQPPATTPASRRSTRAS